MTIGPPWYLKVYAAMRKMYTSPRYTNDETRCVSVHAHEHALHAIDAQHEPKREPPHVAAIERGAEIKAPIVRSAQLCARRSRR